MGDLYNLDRLVPNQDVIDWANGKNRIVQPDVDTSSYARHNAITKGLGVLNGINGMINAGQTLVDTNDTPAFNYALGDMRSLASRDYQTNEQLANSMAQATYAPRQNYQDVRGMTKGQEALGVASAGLNGIKAGSRFGWIGAAIGGLVGTGYGFMKMNEGRNNAVALTNYGNESMDLARNNANLTFQAEGEQIADFNHRGKIGRVVKNGGQIQREQREQEDIQHFANRVLGKKNSILPQRTMCKGGVMVKIRTK